MWASRKNWVDGRKKKIIPSICFCKKCCLSESFCLTRQRQVKEMCTRSLMPKRVYLFFFSCFAFPSITGQSETMPVVVAAGTLRRAYQQFGFPKAVGILNHVTISLSHISLKVAGIVNVWNCWNVKLKRVTHIQYFNTKMVNVTYIKMPKCNLFYVYLFCWGWRG